MFDRCAPRPLIDLTTWFASVLRDPYFFLTADERNKAALHVTSHSMSRLKIYNRDYWVKHIEALAKLFPLLFKHVGNDEFNFLAISFMIEQPPKEYALRLIGNAFPAWIEKNYNPLDKTRVLELIQEDMQLP